ncbi:hypothetical protein [Flagellimonas meridianipacifica]|nr:hypothetical protein [Allomuricauda pacifica]
MKKIIFAFALLASIGFTGCSSDDDSSSSNCTTCSITLLDITTSTEYCDNGDGTVTATTEGESETVDLEGISFDAFIAQLGLIADCN